MSIPPTADRHDYVRRAQAMLDAHPLFDVPKNEWAEVCRGLMLQLTSLRAVAEAPPPEPINNEKALEIAFGSGVTHGINVAKHLTHETAEAAWARFRASLQPGFRGAGAELAPSPDIEQRDALRREVAQEAMEALEVQFGVPPWVAEAPAARGKEFTLPCVNGECLYGSQCEAADRCIKAEAPAAQPWQPGKDANCPHCGGKITEREQC